MIPRLGELSLGCAQLGNLYRAVGDEQARATVNAAWNAGIRYFDTAPHYGLGLSERRLGEALAGRPRHEYILSTKVGRLLEPLPGPHGADTEGFDVPATHRRVWDFSRDGVLRSVEESLRRLKLDRVDIIYLHDPDKHYRNALTLAYPALEELRGQGVVSAIGAGMNQTAMLADFARDTDMDLLMLAGRYTLLEQTALDELLPVCAQRGIGVVAAGVFNSGLLARRTPTRGARYNYSGVPPRLLQHAGRIAAICEQHSSSLPAAALAFPVGHPAVVSICVGARSPEQVERNLALFRMPPPSALWAQLKDEGLLRADAPVPAVGRNSAGSLCVAGPPSGVGGLILAAVGGTIAGVSTALRELLIRHVDAGTIPGGVALLGAGNAEVVTVGVASIGGGPMGADAIMRIQSMTKVITSVAALRLVEAGRLGLDQSLVDWLPELADRQVLRDPTAELDDTVPARRAITLRHLLTNTSGYGMMTQASPLQQAMAANGTEAGPEPPTLGAQEWLRRLAELPLAFQPGEGWRYHHSFGVLGILLSRVTGRPLGEHLAEDVFGPLGMSDTALWVPEGKLDRLPAAYRHADDGLVETEPAGGGFYAGPPPFDVSHGELVSTAADYHRFAAVLAGRGRVNGQQVISPDHLLQLASDQVPAVCKTADSFSPGFWEGMGWGFGVAVKTAGTQRGRIGWSGGQGTDFFIDPDGTVGILLTQVELGEHMWPLVEQFQSLHEPS